jgi:hypothetical protein
MKVGRLFVAGVVQNGDTVYGREGIRYMEMVKKMKLVKGRMFHVRLLPTLLLMRMKSKS